MITKNKTWLTRLTALAFLTFGFCVSVPPVEAQTVKATFSENNDRSPELIYLLEQKQPDGSWVVRYSAPGSPMIFEELAGFHTYRVRARNVVQNTWSEPSNEASITLYAPPNRPGLDSPLTLERSTESPNVLPPPEET